MRFLSSPVTKLNIAGFQQLGSRALTYGQPHTGKRELLLKVPRVSCCPPAKGGCPRGQPGRKMVCDHGSATPAQGPPSHSNGRETGKDTEALDLHSSNQGTHKHSIWLSWESNLWLRGSTSLRARAIPTPESVVFFFILATHLPFLLYMG